MNPLVALFLLHYLADFILQPRWMGVNKSSNNKVLLQHISIIFTVITLGMWLLVPFKIALEVGAVNAIIHMVIDKFIWNIYKAYTGFKLFGIGNITHQQKQETIKAFKYWEDKVFYDTIGTDQLLHSLTLILVWRLFV